MKLGLSSWTYSWNIGVPGYPQPTCPMTAMDLLKKAHELGAQVLQIADNLPLEALSLEELDALAAQAKAWNISIEAGTRGVQPHKMTPFLDVAVRLGATFVRTLLHDADGCPTVEEARQNLLALIPELEKRGLTLGVENHDFFHTLQIKELIESLNTDCIGVCLDPVNNFAQGESTLEVLTNLGALTVNFHCKDYTIHRKSSNLGFDVEGTPTGEGMLDVPRCRKFLHEDMSCVIELWTPWQGDADATAQVEADWAQRSVQYLKTVL